MSEGAKQLVQRLQRNPADLALLAQAKQALVAERRYKTYIKVMRWWARRAPTPQQGAQGLFESGELAQQKLKDDAQAIELFEAALALDPQHTAASAALAALRHDPEFADLMDGFDAESVPPPGPSSHPPPLRSSRAPARPHSGEIAPPKSRRRSVPPPAAPPSPRSSAPAPVKRSSPRPASPVSPPPAVSVPKVGGPSFFPEQAPPPAASAPPPVAPAPAAHSPSPVPPPLAAPPPAVAPAVPGAPAAPGVADEDEPTGPFRSEPPVPAAVLQPPPDGFEPALYDDEAEAREDAAALQPAAFPIGMITGDASLPLSSPASGPARLQVVRRRGDTVLGATTLRFWGRAGSGALSARRAGPSSYRVRLGDGAAGWLRRAADGPDAARHSLSAQAVVRMEPGDVAEVAQAGVIHRVVVTRVGPPPLHGREPWPIKRQATAVGIAFAIHMLALGAIASLSSMGVSFRVETRTRDEIFAEARMKPPEERPKPKLKKPKPVKLRKRRKQQPKPPETEAQAKIPKSLRKRLRKIARTRSASSGNAVDRLVTALKSPVAGEGQTLKEVVSNIDAVKGGESAGAFRIGGTLAALEGGSPNIVSSGGGEVGTLGGEAATGKLTRLKAKKGGAVRGKVSTIKALAKVQGSLSRGEVQKVINENQHKMQRCYERALNAKPSLAGKLTYTWTIKTSGSVGTVRNAGNTMGDAGVAKCIAGVIKHMRFPRPKGGPVEVTYPFIFKRAM